MVCHARRTDQLRLTELSPVGSGRCSVPPLRCPCLVGVEWNVRGQRLTLGGVAASVSQEGGHFVARPSASLAPGIVGRFYGQIEHQPVRGRTHVLVGLIKITEMWSGEDDRQHVQFVFLRGPAVLMLELPRG